MEEVPAEAARQSPYTVQVSSCLLLRELLVCACACVSCSSILCSVSPSVWKLQLMLEQLIMHQSFAYTLCALVQNTLQT